MKRTRIQPDLNRFPEEVARFLEGAALYDSSCSPEARVTFIDREDGAFLKTAEAGAPRFGGKEMFHGPSIAIGTGTVHDITRFCAHERGIGFVSCPTGASVDGFCSTVAAMTEPSILPMPPSTTMTRISMLFMNLKVEGNTLPR